MEHNDANFEQKFLEEIEQKILVEGHSVWGHGTSTPELAESILKEGITGNPAYGLLEMAIPLTEGDNSAAKNSHSILNSITNWPHKNCKYVVMVEVPDTYRKDQLVEEYFDEEKKSYRSRLPSRFIKGYVDSLNLKFIENPLFKENAEPTLDQTQKVLPLRKQKDIESVSIPIPTSSKNNVDDVW